MGSDPRGSLDAKRREIETLIKDLTASLDAAGSSSNRSRSDRYGLSSDRHSQVATLQQLRHQETEIERALAKLDDGTYGLCDRCGTRISQERLDIQPWASLCVPCAAST